MIKYICSSRSLDDQAVSFDAVKQTRGSGRNYASLSGLYSNIILNPEHNLSYT